MFSYDNNEEYIKSRIKLSEFDTKIVCGKMVRRLEINNDNIYDPCCYNKLNMYNGCGYNPYFYNKLNIYNGCGYNPFIYEHASVMGMLNHIKYGYLQSLNSIFHDDEYMIDGGVFDEAVVMENAKLFDRVRIKDNAIVLGHAEIHGNAVIYGNATIADNVIIKDSVTIGGKAVIIDNALICGKVNISGNVKIGGYAFIEDDNDYLYIDGLGSSKEGLTFYKTKDSKVIGASYREFIGTLEELEDYIIEHYGVYDKITKELVLLTALVKVHLL